MAKILLLFFAALISDVLFSQSTSTNLNIDKYIENTPASPNAAALTKYVGAGVSLNTGMPNYSIPIYELKFKSINLPISLSYASNGVKVNEVPGLTGMGWMLNAGGVITRQRNGAADEYAQRMELPDDVNTCSTQFHDFVFNYSDPAILSPFDTQPDVFTFNFNGYTGKFVLDANKKPFLLPKSNLKIDLDFSNAFYTFKITTPDGLKYYFGGDNATEETLLNVSNRVCTYGSSGGTSPNSTPVKTAFYLNRIETPQNESITFSYDIFCYEQRPANLIEVCNHVIESHVCSSGTSACPSTRVMYYDHAYYRYRLLSQINIPQLGRIEFSYGTYNTLSGTDSYSDYKTLSSIKVINNQGRTTKMVGFGYSNVETIIGTNDTYPGLIPSRSKRPFLTNVNDGVNVYHFDYYRPDSLPVFASFSQDLWGFYNGQNNAHFIPNIGLNLVDCPEAIANRNVYPEFVKYGMLKKITSPTGGYDSLIYEGNINAGGPLGGVRVSKIITFDNVTKLQTVKKYYYAPLNDINSSSYCFGAVPLVQGQKIAGYVCPPAPPDNVFSSLATCSYQFTSSQPVNDLNTYGGNNVSYQFVTEGFGENFENGAIQHEFRVQNNNYAYNVMNASIYDAPLNFDQVFNGTEPKTKTYKKTSSDMILVNERRYFYSIDTSSVNDRIIGWKSHLNWTFNTGVACNYEEAEVSKMYYYRFWPHLDSSFDIQYDESGTRAIFAETRNFYENAQHLQVTKSQRYDSKGNVIEVVTKYPHDFVSAGNVYDSMVAKNMLFPIEVKTTKGSESFRVKNNYSFDWFSDKHLIAISNIEAQKNLNPTESRVRYYSYNTFGDFLELGKENDFHSSYLRDYNNSLITAEIKNASFNDVAYTSFEGDAKGNWNYNGVPISDNTAPTGKKVYNLTASYPIMSSNLISTDTYTVSYWTTNSSAFILTGTIAGYPVLKTTIGNWKLFEHKVTGVNNVTFSGTGLLDELRLYPANAQMVTYTYEPLFAMIAQSDQKDKITYYESDDFGRLITVRDQFRNIAKKYCYNVTNGIGVDDGVEPECFLYYNDIQNGSFTKNDCPSGYIGGNTLTYTVPGGTYWASSLSTANALAASDILSNGQAYANTYGNCVIQCTTSNCSGIDKKCINNICSTGAKIYTSSVFDTTLRKYVCTYHYEWSDGSTSQNFTEISNTACFVPAGGV